MHGNSSPRAIGVLGMHRSGTSAVTRALNLLGVSLGPEQHLIAGSADNAEGYWENRLIVELSNELLSALRRSWDTGRPLPDGWCELPEVAPFIDEYQRLIQTDFADLSLWAWKDPRSCILLPLWQILADRIGFSTSYVIVVRNPLDVAASIYKRDGLDYERALDMWALYTLGALRDTAGRKRIVISYDDFMADWRPTMTRVATVLDIPWPDDDQLTRSMESAIKPGLRHNRSDVGLIDTDPRVTDTVHRLYQLCRQAIAEPELVDTDAFTRAVDTLYGEYKPGGPQSEGLELNSGNMQIFWPENGTYSHLNSIRIPIRPDGDYHEYVIELPENATCPLRIDPDNYLSVISIRSISVTYNDGTLETWRSSTDFDRVNPGAWTLRWESASSLGLVGIDGDPQFVLPNQDLRTADLHPVSIRITASISRLPADVAGPVASAFRRLLSGPPEAIAGYAARVRARDAEIASLRHELAAVRASRSWRLVRRVFGAFGNVLRVFGLRARPSTTDG